jgi:hypothetical protein
VIVVLQVLQLIALRKEAKASSEGDGAMSPSAPRLDFTVTVGMVEVRITIRLDHPEQPYHGFRNT